MGITSCWKVKQEIEKGSIKNSYLLIDENEFIKREIINLLESTLVNKKTKAFDMTRFYGREIPDDIYRQMTSLPISSKRHLTVVFDVDMAKNGKEEIKKAVSLSSPLLCNVLTSEKIKGKKSQFMLWLLSKTCVVRCNNISGEDIKKWISKFVERKGRVISDKAVYLLLDFIGNDMFFLSSEIEKILAFTKDKEIKEKDIEGVVGEYRISSVSEIEEAICKRDVKMGMKAVERLFMWGEHPALILGYLGRWLSASAMGEAWRNKLDPDEALKGMSTLMEFESEIRGGQIDDKFAVREFIYKLINRL